MTVLFALTVVGQALTPSTYFTTVDKERLRTIFLSAQPYQTDNLQAVHYSVLGLALLGAGHVEPSVRKTYLLQTLVIHFIFTFIYCD